MYDTRGLYNFKSSPPGQNVILQTIFSDAYLWMKSFVFWLKFHRSLFLRVQLTHWGRMIHICVSKTTIIGSDNGLSPDRRQAIIGTNAGILSIGPLGTNFSEILIKCYSFSFKKMHMKMSSGKWRPSCLGLNVLRQPSVNISNFIPLWNCFVSLPWELQRCLSKFKVFSKLQI